MTPAKPYISFSDYIKNKYKVKKIHKLTLNNYATCPNKDGTRGWGGCFYCNTATYIGRSNNYAYSLTEQIQTGMAYITPKYKCLNFLAYFNNNTSTYLEPAIMAKHLQTILQYPAIRGVIFSSRPDAISEDFLDLIAKYQTQLDFYIELGIQSLWEASLQAVNRGHTVSESISAVQKIQDRNIPLIVHLVFGLPQEPQTKMLAGIDQLVQMGIKHFKFHNLIVLKDTRLEKLYLERKIELLGQSAYFELLGQAIMALPPDAVVHRLFGDAPQALLKAPDWIREKHKRVRDFAAFLQKNNYYQGKNFKKDK